MTIHRKRIDEIKNLLQEDSLKVRMRFLKRGKNRKTKESTYTLFKAPIKDDVKQAFIDGAKK